MRLRGLGELERAIMEVVRAADGLVTGRAVVDQLARERPTTYTTVLPVMDCLVRKGMLTRHRQGRAYTYQAATYRAAYTAALMASVLGSSNDHAAVLLHFVEQIPRPGRGAQGRPRYRPPPRSPIVLLAGRRWIGAGFGARTATPTKRLWPASCCSHWPAAPPWPRSPCRRRSGPARRPAWSAAATSSSAMLGMGFDPAHVDAATHNGH